MRRLLVTGGAGFIGCNFVHYWLRKYPGDRVVVLDALTYAGNPRNLDPVRDHPGFRFVKGDICDTALVESLLREEQLDTIVHFAAESHVDRSILGPDAFVQTNVVGTHALLRAARSVWLDGARVPHRFHHVSTDEVYGALGPGDPPFSESTPYAPNSPYAASKAASDHLVRAYNRTYGLETTISNCSNNYGPYQFPEKLISLVILNILESRALPIYGDGLQVRDWLYVEDHCAGIDRILELGRSGETYNIGGNCEVANIDLVRRLCGIVDEQFRVEPALKTRFPLAPPSRGEPSESLITFVRDRPSHDRRYAIDMSKARRELQFVPAVSLEDGLRRVVRWYLDNEAWWRGVLSGEYRSWLNLQYGFELRAV